MEKSDVSPSEIKERLSAAGISVTRFAAEARLYGPEAYSILAGGPVGPRRLARINEAAQRLGLTDATPEQK